MKKIFLFLIIIFVFLIFLNKKSDIKIEDKKSNISTEIKNYSIETLNRAKKDDLIEIEKGALLHKKIPTSNKNYYEGAVKIKSSLKIIVSDVYIEIKQRNFDGKCIEIFWYKILYNKKEYFVSEFFTDKHIDNPVKNCYN